MYKQYLSLVAGLLATAAFALTPGTALAQRRGGGRGSAGAWHGSAGAWRGGTGAWRGGTWGGRGWDGGRWRGDWDRGRGWGWGWGGLGLGLALGSPWYGGYGYGGYWPGSYGYDYSPSYYGSDWSMYNGTPYYGDTSNSYSGQMSGDMSSYGYGAPARAEDDSAHIRVVVPPDAKVWFGNTATQQTGRVRFFDSPQLTPGKDYSYDIKAQWTQDGKEVTHTRHLDVRANAGFTVDFTREMLGAGTANGTGASGTQNR